MSKTKEMKPILVQELLRYEFNESELKQKSRDLARAVQLQASAQEEQKAANAQFKERVETQTAVISKLSREINNGWEMRMLDCAVKMHTPNTGFKTFVRVDTGEFVRECAMTRLEMQEPLEFEDEDEEESE